MAIEGRTPDVEREGAVRKRRPPRPTSAPPATMLIVENVPTVVAVCERFEAPASVQSPPPGHRFSTSRFAEIAQMPATIPAVTPTAPTVMPAMPPVRCFVGGGAEGDSVARGAGARGSFALRGG